LKSFLLSALLGLCFLRIAAQSPPDPAHVPVKAELIKNLDVRRIQKGSPVFARVLEDWNGQGCTLHSGAIIEAKVEIAQPTAKPNHDSQLALSFSNAQCNGNEMVPIDLVIAAVSWNREDNITMRGNYYPIVKNTYGPGGSIAPGNVDLDGIEFKSSQLFTAPPTLHAGDVYGIRGVKMQMGAGPGGSSLFYSKSRDVVLDQYTQFLLLPTSAAFVRVPKSTAGLALKAAVSASSIVSAPAPPPPPREFEPCSPPSCNVDLPAASDVSSNHPSKSIAIQSLGYAPRLNRDISQLDDEEALMWVGDQRILVAFNPHTLVHRNGDSTIDAPVRRIRAVLLDVATSRVLSTVDWDLSDSGKFLWQLSGNQVLVHAENQLRVYDAQLALQSRFELTGPLGFLRISPNGELIAIGIVHEKHSQELHQKLTETLGQNPEEDVEILVLDKEFKIMARATTASNLMPPTLLNEGQLTLMAQPNMRYRLALLTWDNQAVTLARFSSGCKPELSSLAPNLVFIRSCDKTTGLPEFRVLRTDGKVVWREQPSPEEFGHEAKGNDVSRTFAIKILHASTPVRPGAVFHGTDLTEEEIRVYRATDGKRLSSFRSPAPAPSHGGYGLSPDGARLAILSSGQIGIYPVPLN
jgi:hypothetical protein